MSFATWAAKRAVKERAKDKRLLRTIVVATRGEASKIRGKMKPIKADLAKNTKKFEQLQRVNRKLGTRRQPSKFAIKKYGRHSSALDNAFKRQDNFKRKLTEEKKKILKRQKKVKKERKNLSKATKQIYTTSRRIRKATPWVTGGIVLGGVNAVRVRRKKRNKKRRIRRDRKGRFR